jgi:hypothetical protein
MVAPEAKNEGTDKVTSLINSLGGK